MRHVGKSGIDKCLAMDCDNKAFSRGVCQKHYIQYTTGYDKTIPIYEPHRNNISNENNVRKKFCRKHFSYLNDTSVEFESEENCEYPGCKDNINRYLEIKNKISKNAEIRIEQEGLLWIVSIDFGSKYITRPLHNGIRTEKEAWETGGNWAHKIVELGVDNINDLNLDRPYIYGMRKGCKKRAKEQGGLCTISIYDIVIPKYCPVLGIELRRTTKDSGSKNSPSIDKIVPEKWYVPGNVQVISWRANVAKHNLSKGEMKLMADYFYKMQSVL